VRLSQNQQNTRPCHAELGSELIKLTAYETWPLADVVEAIASQRPYRPALGIDAALEEIEKNKGVLYAPAIVDICLSLFKEKGFAFS